MFILHYWPHQVPWATFDLGYPEQFAFYCFLPHPAAKGPNSFLIIIRLDKVSRYAPPLAEVGAKQILYEDFANLGQHDYLECNLDE